MGGRKIPNKAETGNYGKKMIGRKMGREEQEILAEK